MKKQTWLAVLGVCLVLATLAPLASPAPDGLEKVAGDNGFLGMSRGSPVTLMAEYLFPGVENRALATVFAAWLGTLVVFGLGYGIARIIYRFRKAPASR
jgi:cobalt/nickel transport protein